MRNFVFFLITLYATLYHIAYAQTPVSGAIFSNTVWSKANSPYVVVDKVIVYPGVTLTIEPGNYF